MLWTQRFVISRNSSKSTFQALLVGSESGNTRISPSCNASWRSARRRACHWSHICTARSPSDHSRGGHTRYSDTSHHQLLARTGRGGGIRSAISAFSTQSKRRLMCVYATVLAATSWWRWHINLGRPWGTQSGFTIADQKTPDPSSKKGSNKTC